MKNGCVFCNYVGPSEVLKDYGAVFVIAPIDPVTEGHVLVIPRRHVTDFTDHPWTSMDVMEAAARYIAEERIGSCNVITSVGPEATQTVFHLHVHVVPRRDGDHLALPWAPNLQRLRELVDRQAEDEGLWFFAETAPEAYLQQELRKLHAAIEGTG